MIIDCIADLHGYKPNLEGGDILLLAGDYTFNDTLMDWIEFFKWLKKQQYNKKILIAGNHDGLFYKSYPKTQQEANAYQDFLNNNEDIDFEYLCDSGTEYDGIKIWGTPWTPWFSGVNPKCKYFMESESIIEKKFKLIPDNIDILITHGPMSNVLDKNLYGIHCGSTNLRKEIKRAKPKIHIFGHIHEQAGSEHIFENQTLCINCALVDEFYEPRDKTCRIVVKESKKR